MGKKNSVFSIDIQSHSNEVTGSCYRCTIRYPNGQKETFLMDAGLFQEKEYKDLNRELPCTLSNVKFMTISHAHLDHIGKIPFFIRKKLNCPIYTSKQTKLLSEASLMNSYKINKRYKDKDFQYNKEDVNKTIQQMKVIPYNETYKVNDNIKVTFFINGHIFGANLVLIQVSYPGEEDINLLFTGDYNDKNQFFYVPELPDWVKKLKLNLMIESTYGDRISTECVKKFADNTINAIKEGKNILVLAYSLGRVEDVCYMLKLLQKEEKIPKDVKILIAGDLAIRYIKIISKKDFGLEEKFRNFLPENVEFINKNNKRLLSSITKQKIIIATSGNGNFGPGHNYIISNIENENWMIHFTGYIPEGSFGKKLKHTDINSSVMIGGKEYIRRAQIEYTKEFSAHAHMDQLLKFMTKFENIKSIMVVHGTQDIKEQFKNKSMEELDYKDDNIIILNRSKVVRIVSNGIEKVINSKLPDS